jgi:hypothetical protein
MRAQITCLVAALLCFGVTGASAGGMQSAPPEQITIVDTVTAQTSDGNSGTFTASGLVCPTGTFVDVETSLAISTTRTCNDGSGEFDAKGFASQGGLYTITDGTGHYTDLRGHGQCHVDFGPPIVRTCQFLAAFDDVAPSAAITRFTATRAPHHGYRVKTFFTSKDDVPENQVSYKLSVVAGSRVLAARHGTVDGTPKAFVLTLKPPKSARKLTLTLRVTDPVGNTRTIHRIKALR